MGAALLLTVSVTVAAFPLTVVVTVVRGRVIFLVVVRVTVAVASAMFDTVSGSDSDPPPISAPTMPPEEVHRRSPQPQATTVAAGPQACRRRRPRGADGGTDRFRRQPLRGYSRPGRSRQVGAVAIETGLAAAALEGGRHARELGAGTGAQHLRHGGPPVIVVTASATALAPSGSVMGAGDPSLNSAVRRSHPIARRR